MNIVFVKHADNTKEFAFYVPDELIGLVAKGQGVLCKTMHGLCYGVTTTGVISGEGAKDIALSHGAYVPLKPIVGIAHVALAQDRAIRQQAAQVVLDAIKMFYGRQEGGEAN